MRWAAAARGGEGRGGRQRRGGGEQALSSPPRTSPHRPGPPRAPHHRPPHRHHACRLASGHREGGGSGGGAAQAAAVAGCSSLPGAEAAAGSGGTHTHKKKREEARGKKKRGELFSSNIINAINIGVSTAGNTAGTTGTVEGAGGQYMFVGSNGITLSQSTNGANSGTMTIHGVPPGTATMWFPFNEAVNVTVAPGQGSFLIAPVPTPPTAALGQVHLDRVCFPVSVSNASNSTGSITLTFLMGLYTKNASTLSLAHSTSQTTNWTFSGTNSASLQHGVKLFTIPWTTSIDDGRYYVGVGFRSTSGGANATISQIGMSQMASNFSGVFGAASNRSVQWPLGFGMYSASTTGVPGSIGFSQIDGTASVAARPPTWFMISSTV